LSRLRQIYQTDLLYVTSGCTPASGQLSDSSQWGNPLSFASGASFVSELFRIQKIDNSWTKKLRPVEQFGQLGQLDRVTIDPPEVSLSFSYLLSNLVNENLLGFQVSNAGNPNPVSCLSGILSSATDDKNYFIKTVAEGSDAISTNPSSYSCISFGNGFVGNYTSQGSVGSFPTVDVSVVALNSQAQSITQGTPVMTPAVFPANGTNITGWFYQLPTGTTSFNNVGLTNISGLSVLRPGDINLNLSSIMNAGDGYFAPTDIKIQSYNLSFNLNLEDLQQLGSKYAYAKVPKFPVEATLSVTALAGDLQTGSLVEIVNNNLSFNPSITINQPNTTTPVVYYQLRNAKLDSQASSMNIGTNKTITLSFMTTIGGPSDTVNGVYMSGITANI